MIGLKGRMTVIDNSGALVAECINVLKVKTRLKSTGFATVGACGELGTGGGGDELKIGVGLHRPSFLLSRSRPRKHNDLLQELKANPLPGDEIVCVVNKARPVAQGVATGNIQKVRKGDVRRAVIVRTKKPVMRPDGRVIR